MSRSQTNRRLGYPVDARLLIINADDFGLCHGINEAVFRALKQGMFRSKTLMVPCLGFAYHWQAYPPQGFRFFDVATGKRHYKRRRYHSFGLPSTTSGLVRKVIYF